MLSALRFYGFTTVAFAVCGSAMAQPIAPPGTGVTINKQVIDNGISHSVRYFVTGGSPQLQALVRRVEFAENELSVIGQLQMLKLETVVNERRLAAVRTTQLINPNFPSGFCPPSYATGYGVDGASSLQRALSGQLAYEATPQAALQMIGFLEQQQIQLDAELKALPPHEKKAAEVPIDALRPKLAALPGAKVPPQPAAHAPAGANVVIEVKWGSSWFAAEKLRENRGETLIHYTGWSSTHDEWVPASRIRPAVTVLPPIKGPSDLFALQRIVNQQFEITQQRLLQPR